MHKKLDADLTSLAHSILQMKNREDVFALKNKAYEVYEKLAVLAYVEEYINNTPNPEHSKEELLEKIESVEESPQMEESKQDLIELETEEVIVKHRLEDEVETLEESLVEEESTEEEGSEEEEESTQQDEIELLDVSDPEVDKKEVVKEIEEKALDIIEDVTSQVVEEVKEAVEFIEEAKTTHSLDEELKDTIAVDVVADLFENATKKSLNDKLQGDIQIGLNDRIAFVKNLFDGSQEDFNRVVSQLNTFKTEKEAKKFINKMVKPDYNWSEKEEFEERFMAIIERKFV